MRRLIAVELRRNIGRRMFRVLLALSLLGITIGAVASFLRHEKTPASQVSRIDDQRLEQFERCMRGEIVVVRPEMPPGPPQIIDENERERFCQEAIGSDFLGIEDKRLRLTGLSDAVRGSTPTFVMFAFLLAASFIGAEWRANTISQTLTWEPRRVRLLLAKAVAAVVVGAGLTIALQGLIILTQLPTAFLRGTIEGAGTAWASEVSGLILRAGAVSAIAAAIAFSLGSVGRNTSAAFGMAFLYLVVLEGILATRYLGWRPWMIGRNVEVLIEGRSTFELASRTTVEAGLLLGAYAAGFVALATTMFRRRDVT